MMGRLKRDQGHFPIHSVSMIPPPLPLKCAGAPQRNVI
jgi:hypothetical protein